MVHREGPDIWKPTGKAEVSLPELERSLFLEMREMHTKCNSFIWDLDSAAPGCCTSCMAILDGGKGGCFKPLLVPDNEKRQVFFYKLRNGMIFGTTQGIWNMN